MRRYVSLIALLLACGIVRSTDAAVQEFTDRAAWESAAGAYSTIDFTGFPLWTQLSTQYTASHGVTFTSPAFVFNSLYFLNDEWGMMAPGQARIELAEPRYAVGIDGSGVVEIRLFRKGELIYSSSLFAPYQTLFAGLVSDVEFDAVQFYKEWIWGTHVWMDDLLIGPPIPAPGALGAFALAALIGRRRRRRG
jgi:MYXO-CTERM domain-containing protein